MIRLGRVLHISSSKNIIVKVENIPKLGERVVDENLKLIGEVFDIFGPVSRPYVAVKPQNPRLNIIADKALYVFPSKKKGK
ncbi:MAG: Gar1/Naf1 family protein [Candidatus Bathyarchaeia archaeon]|nr:hypothetical protein [Candidatus Bathyarchaeota archaeon]